MCGDNAARKFIAAGHIYQHARRNALPGHRKFVSYFVLIRFKVRSSLEMSFDLQPTLKGDADLTTYRLSILSPTP
jgi:hypothetical protein